MTDVPASSLTHADRALMPAAMRRAIVIGLIAFFSLVDLFAAQAMLPALIQHYHVSPAAMGLAVNACTLGMAISSLATGLLSPLIDRRIGIVCSLALLTVFTALLASAPNLTVFAGLRILQGLCMASAFALTLAYLGEQCSATEAGGAFSAYIAGNVASNLVGRLVSASLTGALGLEPTFYVFAALNLFGALLVGVTIGRGAMMASTRSALRSAAIRDHLGNSRLRAAFGIGFCVLFAFIGAFTFVNFVLVRPPLSLGMMSIGLVYVVFLPSIVTTLLAGRIAARTGARRAIWGSLAITALGLALMLSSQLATVLAGMVLVGAGTFFAQAVTTGFVGKAATHDQGVASGIYLASYFSGGIVGTAVLGQLFDRFGWTACVAGIAAALVVAAALTGRLMPARA
ncbi:putative transporter [Bradyrhizobium sp. ORS 375]|uniref:MFS transporter n=1 Tax=Bradyrhizobium sp. (strain ORS 375) TaxID=566679 RepID=UPI0002409642|nr:MFS transporter [Bradyrhizobium sp. ORS 375]CCD92192.1 putative transporter [Bradyrhizobium sp. ORS 375]